MNMRRVGYLVAPVFVLLVVAGCRGKEARESSEVFIENEVVQSGNGDILLALKDAYLFNDDNFPDRNTAEWNFMVKSEGRYEVWLSSLTQDTMNLGYNTPVIVNFGDKRIESQPIGDEILIDKGVTKPYYRADSRIGSIYIDDPGHYNLQVISEKVLPGSVIREGAAKGVTTILDQIKLKPLTN